MQDSITIDNIDVLTNWVFMLRADAEGALWLSDDDAEARFYEKISHKSSRVIPAHRVALSLLDSVEKTGVQGVVAVLRGVGLPSDGHNIFRPYCGDTASLLMMSKAGNEVITQVGGSSWLRASDKEIGSIQRRVILMASSIAHIRQACGDVSSLKLSSEQLHEVIAWESFELAWPKLEWILGAVGTNQIDQIRETCTARDRQDVHSLLPHCDGIDAIHLFAAATQYYRPRGLSAYRQVDADTLMTMLRSPFDPSDIEGDEIFWKMKRWERANRRYPLLRHWRELDSLGVLWDQRYWEKDMAALLRTLEPGATLAVLKMDLDNFKPVNDRCGHTVGDEALRLYCSIVREVLGTVGEVYRRGGDEIVVLAPGMAEGTAREFAERTRAEIESRFGEWASVHDLDVPPTASIGLTMVDSGRSVTQTLDAVDRAQRHAKEQGKNRVAVVNT
jgi:diguanylate cyclase (GGDEF)-like protein